MEVDATSLPAPAKGPCWREALLGERLLWPLGLAVCFLYGCLHFVVVHEPGPLTIREQAFVESVRFLKEAGFASLYSYEALPQRANLYGPFYPTLVSWFVSWAADPYLVHRVVVAGLLVAACAFLAAGLPKGVPILPRLLAAAFLYSAHVASPSVAAGPDTLMLAVYALCIALLGRHGASWRGLLVATLGLVLLFFSKPYGILVWGGYVSYLFLFRSVRWAVVNVVLSAAVGAVIALLISRHWPAYGFSVLGIHAYFASSFFSELVAQVRDFAFLNFGLLFLAGCGLWPAARRVWGAGSPVDAWRALRDKPPSFAVWMTLVAAVALLGRLGWHGGAYLIYFYHLLLPPLLLFVFGEVWGSGGAWRLWARGMVAANLGLVLFLLPPWPEARRDRFLPLLGVAWVEPELEAWALQESMVELIDNSQGEYLVYAGARSSDPEVRRRAREWLATTAEKLKSGAVRYVVLNAFHNRPLFAWGQKPTPFFLKHYRPVHAFATRPYFLAFRDRRAFGRLDLDFVVFEHRSFAKAVGEGKEAEAR